MNILIFSATGTKSCKELDLSLMLKSEMFWSIGTISGAPHCNRTVVDLKRERTLTITI